MKKQVFFPLIIIATLFMGVAVALRSDSSEQTDSLSQSDSIQQDSSQFPITAEQPTLPRNELAREKFHAPIDRAVERVTKKPFGIHVSPNNSPVSPEKFSGYHSGVDFETFADEKDNDVVISTICSGPLLVKKTAQGYGGVIVQSCVFQERPITVIYGHMKLSSIAVNVGTAVAAGERIGILGAGYSLETDGERKHLHLGIHRGSTVTLRGYVQSEQELSAWIDIQKYL